MSNNKDKKDDQLLNILLSKPEDNIPKFCNKVLFGESDDHIVFTFLSVDKLNENEEQGVLAGRIAVSKEHAKRIVDVLGGLLKNK